MSEHGKRSPVAHSQIVKRDLSDLGLNTKSEPLKGGPAQEGKHDQFSEIRA